MALTALTKRRHLIYFIGLVAALGCFAYLTQSTAQGDHGVTSLEVQECQGYQHVLETDDQLYLCRYNVVEAEHPPGSPIGPAVAIGRIQSTTPLVIHKNVSLPALDHALVGFYFGDDDADKPVWNDADLEVLLLENPTLFPIPVESTPESILFNTGPTNLEETSDELVDDLPKIMLRLETQDPTAAAGSYVVGTGITNVGRPFVTDAYGPLDVIASGAFQPEVISAGTSVTGPAAPGFISGIAAAGRQSGFATGIEGLGGFFGLPYIGSLLALMAILFGGVVALIKKYGGEGSESTMIFWILPILLVGGYLGDGTILFGAAVLLVAMTLFIGGAMFIQRVVST